MPGAFLDFDAVAKGINNTVISGLESWTFDWNVGAKFLGIDLSGLTGSETFAIQCNSWIGASITPGDPANTTFDSVTGTFYLGTARIGDTFDTAALYGTSTVPTIAPGVDIVMRVGTEGDGMALGLDFTWNLVPEPGSLALAAVGGVLGLARRRRA